MTTEELARRFCELVGWKIEVRRGDVWYCAHPGAADVRDTLRLFPFGWAGVGIVVEELERRDFEWGLFGRSDTSAHVQKGLDGDEYAIYIWEWADTPLDAVLAAANAALEAEAGR